MSIRLHLDEVHRRIVWIALICTVFFTVIALTQYFFIENNAQQAARLQAGIWADEVTKALDFTDKWDLKGFGQASILAPSYYIVSEEGLVVEIEGYVPDLIPSPRLRFTLEPGVPQNVTTSVGEPWRLLRKCVGNGSVVLGVAFRQDSIEVEKELIQSAAQFNLPTFEDAVRVPSRSILPDVDYALMDSNGVLATQLGGIPLEFDVSTMAAIKADSVKSTRLGEKEFMVYQRPIVSLAGEIVGRIVIPLDVTLQRNALLAQEKFNLSAVGLSWLVVILLLCYFFFDIERRKRKMQISVEEALGKGESQTAEFKETLEADSTSGEKNPAVLKSALRTIAGFLNSKGGTLFIGISDAKEPKGLEKDYRLCNRHNSDGLEQKLRSLLATRFHPAPLGRVNIRFEEYQGKTICAIDVEMLPKTEVVHIDGEIHVRDGATTKHLDGPLLTQWFQTRFHHLRAA